ncbi:3-hydroxypropionyl-coenzyme A dehydratase, partial [Fragariocoptes setiger]
MRYLDRASTPITRSSMAYIKARLEPWIRKIQPNIHNTDHNNSNQENHNNHHVMVQVDDKPTKPQNQEDLIVEETSSIALDGSTVSVDRIFKEIRQANANDMALVNYKKWVPQVYSICINRTAKRNAIDRQVFHQLNEALRRFESDIDAKVAILSGQGGHFCAGYDLNEFVEIDTGRTIIAENVQQLLLSTRRLFLSSKPIIACIEGYAAGFGLELALRCHYRVADDTAMMGFLNRRFGIPIMNGGTVILPHMIGISRALELIGTGRAMSAREAQSYGLIYQICDTGSAMGKATSFAQSLTKFGQRTLLGDLDSVTKFVGPTLADALESERQNALRSLRSFKVSNTTSGFLKGDVCRHGKFRLHNLQEPNPDCTI